MILVISDNHENAILGVNMMTQGGYRGIGLSIFIMLTIVASFLHPAASQHLERSAHIGLDFS
jgi:hypothetical protein